MMLAENLSHKQRDSDTLCRHLANTCMPAPPFLKFGIDPCQSDETLCI